MFATLRQMKTQHQDTATGDRSRARKARPALEGLERREALSGLVAVAAPAAYVSAAGGFQSQIIITENMTGC